MTTPSPSPHGVLVVDKPRGPSSHGVVAAARKALGTRKIGHAGTLDPMATGVLVLGVGHATRLLTFVVGADKEYLATIRLGERTTTDDAEGELIERAGEALAAVDDARIEACVAGLRGDIDQVPSAVSAIKVDGKRAYQRVRDGEQVELAARRVTVSAFEVLDRRTADARGAIDLDVRVECSSGTYVRALARDLGDALGVGAHLTALRRTRVGGFTLAESTRLPTLGGTTDADANADVGPDTAAAPGTRLIAPADAARRILPALELTASEAVDLGHGKHVLRDAARAAQTPGPAAAFAPDGRLVGVVAWDTNAYRPLMNVPEAAA